MEGELRKTTVIHLNHRLSLKFRKGTSVSGFGGFLRIGSVVFCYDRNSNCWRVYGMPLVFPKGGEPYPFSYYKQLNHEFPKKPSRVFVIMRKERVSEFLRKTGVKVAKVVEVGGGRVKLYIKA